MRLDHQKTARRGAIVIMSAFCLAAIVAFLAFSIDLGYIVVTEAELQNAADAGAKAGARKLNEGRNAAIAAAISWAGKNRAAGEFVGITTEDVEIGQWDGSTATFTVLPEDAPDAPNAIRVTCRRTTSRGNPLTLFFARFIGSDEAFLNASATSCIKPYRCGLIIGLTKVSMSGSSHTDSYYSEAGAYDPATAGANGHVCSNGDIKMSGSTAIRGNGHPGPDGQVDSSSSIGVLGSTDPLDDPLVFPATDPGDAAWSNDNASIPTSDDGVQPLDSGEFTLSGGDGVDLPPGTYYFSKMSLSGGSLIRISGPTMIYVTGDCNLSGGSVANLTLLPKNLQLFAMGSKCVISGGSQFHGVVYGPTAKVEHSGDSDFFGSIVAGELVLSGSGGIHADESLATESLDGGPSVAETRRVTAPLRQDFPRSSAA